MVIAFVGQEHLPQGQAGIGNTSPTHDQQFSSQQQHAPHMSPEAEERELNAAAAREVSREMDVLTFNPPISQINPGSFYDASPDPSAVHHSRGPGFGGGPMPADFGPLAPPSAPFTRRSPSPRPTMDSTVPPRPGASPSMTPAQAYAQTHTSSPSLERVPPEHNSPMGPRLHTTVAPTTHLHDDAPTRSSPLSTQSPFQSPPEQQRSSPNIGGDKAIGIGSSPTTNIKSISSSNLPPAPRTISAAAFKRPQPRKGTSDVSVDTSPLVLKKRLPSSPHPMSRDPSPMSRSASLPPLPPLPGNPQNQNHQSQSGDLDEDYDYLSVYVNVGPMADAGSLGPLRVMNETSEGDRPQSQGVYTHGRGGYGDGRFTTDLEDMR